MDDGPEASCFGIPAWQIRAAQQPLDEAATLPAACYTSADWYRREVAQIFHREWICA